MKYSVLGVSGFIGSNVVKSLQNLGHTVYTPSRNENILDKDLGHVIYCIGITSDFRSRHFETIEAHVTCLNRLLKYGHFDSLLYLSSTRVYYNAAHGREDGELTVRIDEPEELFKLSKLSGESLCMGSNNSNIRVARLSNVCGDDFKSGNFLYSIMEDAFNKGRVILRSSLDSEKDYIGIDSVVSQLLKISASGKRKLYNVASGRNLTHRRILALLQNEIPHKLEVIPNAPLIRFPTICTEYIQKEFGFIADDPESIVQNTIKSFLAHIRK